MKYLVVLLGFLACNFSSKKNVPASDEAGVLSATIAPDSIVPAQYDADKRLLKISKSETEWKNELNELEYYVLREEGTERAFTGDLWDNHEKGTFICRGCGLPLFSSETKFESGTGWPSFWQPIQQEFVTGNLDSRLGMVRTEVECARCGGHLGHVFEDGPKPTGLRYCINSVSLDLVKE